MKVLFWNTHNNPKINTILNDLIVENNISIVVLAEYNADIKNLIDILKDKGLKMQQFVTIGCERIVIIGKTIKVEPGVQTDYLSMQILKDKLLLCCIHLNSQIYADNENQREILIGRIIREIRLMEKKLDTEKTVVVGDFNINPYDKDCIDARYFHGLPIYNETIKRSRTIMGEEFFMFYNPMWNLLGDSKEPYGTYYYSGSKTVNTYWNMYDQVMVRPALRERFIDESLKILTETENTYLTNSKGHPDKNISDHLPIMFEIREDNYE